MLALLDQADAPFVASEAEAMIAKTAAERLQGVADARQDIQIVVRDDTNVIVPLPARAVELIVHLLEIMSKRVPVSIIPHDAELTTQQAADYLNVSRPYITAVIDRDEIAHRMVGRHRRIRFGDLRAYDQKSRAQRKAALAELAAEADRLGLD